MLMSSSKQEDHSGQVASEEADKGSLVSKASMISSGRGLVAPGKETRSVIYSRSSRKCSEAVVAREAHKGDHNSMLRARI